MNFDGLFNVVGDPVTRDAGSTTVTTLSCVHNRKWDGGEQATWVTFQFWGTRGTNAIQPYVSKGDQIYIKQSTPAVDKDSGNPRAWIDGDSGEARTRLVFNALDFEFVRNGNRSGGSEADYQEDDIPF